jgi:hypothetical protein
MAETPLSFQPVYLAGTGTDIAVFQPGFQRVNPPLQFTAAVE